jgi:hypothetical protein
MRGEELGRPPEHDAVDEEKRGAAQNTLRSRDVGIS